MARGRELGAGFADESGRLPVPFDQVGRDVYTQHQHDCEVHEYRHQRPPGRNPLGPQERRDQRQRQVIDRLVAGILKRVKRRCPAGASCWPALGMVLRASARAALRRPESARVCSSAWDRPRPAINAWASLASPWV